MSIQKDLELKIITLEKRIAELEKRLVNSTDNDEKEYMEALYQKAVEIVARYNKSSVIFLQTKLLIDHYRATKVHRTLKLNKVIA